MRALVSVETNVAIFLYRLGTGNGLLHVEELFGFAKNINSCVVREFCKVVENIYGSSAIL